MVEPPYLRRVGFSRSQRKTVFPHSPKQCHVEEMQKVAWDLGRPNFRIIKSQRPRCRNCRAFRFASHKKLLSLALFGIPSKSQEPRSDHRTLSTGRGIKTKTLLRCDPTGLVQVSEQPNRPEVLKKSAKSDLVSLGRVFQESLSHNTSPASHCVKQPEAGVCTATALESVSVYP